jgi:signal transduction histidine kinase
VPVSRVSDERRRIGRELHDTIGQELSGVALIGGALIETIRGHERESARLSAKVVEGVRRAMEQVRALMTGLAPTEVRGDELTNALDEFASRVRTSHAVACTFHERGEVGATTDAAATHLYLIAQEAVTNALKHSQARAIKIDLSAPGDGLVLAVSDDGTGFDDPALRNPNGMGLRIMKERASLAGGALRIQSAPGSGTTVTCILSERNAHEQERHSGGGPTAAGVRPQAGRQGGDR